jgi:hypothetical protein
MATQGEGLEYESANGRIVFGNEDAGRHGVDAFPQARFEG